jgi:hypothetical protein
MRLLTASLKPRWVKFIDRVRTISLDRRFWQRHRRCEGDFTRERVLTFPIIMLLLLQKTSRSIQRHLQSFFQALGSTDTDVTAGAWTQARAKFRHTAFIELNHDVLLPEFYAPASAEFRRTWCGHRLLGVDGTHLRLPNHPELIDYFGRVEVANHRGFTGTKYVPGRLSVLYDLLNHIGLEARLEPLAKGEVELAMSHLAEVKTGDVLIWDMGFTGFPLMARVLAAGAHFVGRCSKSSFAGAQDLFRMNRAGRSVTGKLVAAKEHRQQLAQANLSTELIVRFISLRLPNGELEVLVTSLLDESLYPTKDFLPLYHCRWQHETYHQMLKGRLDLENWTGHTLEAVLQDLHAAVFISNVETMLSQEVQEELDRNAAERKYPARVNRSVSYHALKQRILELFWGNRPLDEAIISIQSWMKANATSVRADRSPPRPPMSFNRSYNYQRNIRKTVF